MTQELKDLKQHIIKVVIDTEKRLLQDINSVHQIKQVYRNSVYYPAIEQYLKSQQQKAEPAVQAEVEIRLKSLEDSVKNLQDSFDTLLDGLESISLSSVEEESLDDSDTE